MGSSFWADPKKTYAKRNNLFLVQMDFNHNAENISDEAKRLFNKVSGIQYVVKAVNLPSFNTQVETDRNVIGGGKKLPKPQPLDWQTVRLTFADFVDIKDNPLKKQEAAIQSLTTFNTAIAGAPVTPQVKISASLPDSSLYHALLQAWHEAFNKDSSVYQGGNAMSLARFRDIFENIVIMTYNDNGDLMEKWSLKGLWPMSFENSSLSYEDDAIREFSIELDYETAEFTYVTPDGGEETIYKHAKRKTKSATVKKLNKKTGKKQVVKSILSRKYNPPKKKDGDPDDTTPTPPNNQ